ncbi:hypothetical protein FQA47_004088 [Oryzias melastigma]|uniref:Uncharacterized protein n=1 Tax=Oryzias melastigma TaxID=30732 RepID=A0A834C787_ORYME|nr:hypothetical protein FQA47_004088 [Oryzias melastigma]
MGALAISGNCGNRCSNGVSPGSSVSSVIPLLPWSKCTEGCQATSIPERAGALTQPELHSGLLLVSRPGVRLGKRCTQCVEHQREDTRLLCLHTAGHEAPPPQKSPSLPHSRPASVARGAGRARCWPFKSPSEPSPLPGGGRAEGEEEEEAEGEKVREGGLWKCVSGAHTQRTEREGARAAEERERLKDRFCPVRVSVRET